LIPEAPNDREHIVRIDAPNIEVYRNDYDPNSPTGTMELWVAIVMNISASVFAWVLFSTITLSGAPALAGQVGERHLIAVNPTAVVRDAEHRATVRVTVWYPAAADAKEVSLDVGPPGKPLLVIGSAAPDATFADDRRRPVILLSHGFGGNARGLAWFALPLVRAGYVVIAVDHPGNNTNDKMTIGGAIMFWDRPGDLAAALEAAKANPEIASHMGLRLQSQAT
jgi:predicted dienelactone hydrolase